MVNHQRHSPARTLAQVSLLSALSIVGRLVFSFIPNVQPMTAILLIICKYWGWHRTSLVAITSVLVSNIFLGMGPWTVMQLVTYLILFALSGLIFNVTQSLSSYAWVFETTWAGVTGLLYGMIISFMWTQIFQINHFWAYYVRGLPFDLMHAGGNVAFYLLLTPVLSKLLKKYL